VPCPKDSPFVGPRLTWIKSGESELSAILYKQKSKAVVVVVVVSIIYVMFSEPSSYMTDTHFMASFPGQPG